jgi:uncharacterized protein
MHISLETPEKHAISAYDEEQIQINSILYKKSFIVSRDVLITNSELSNIEAMTQSYLDSLIELNPEVIVIGHKNLGAFPPTNLLNQLVQKKIGFECMSLGAACRTYNILLGEDRHVVAGFIL